MAPPNNWSGGGGSAWERSHARKQFYFHRFSKGQPDLNWRNPAMEEAMLHVYAELARVDCLAAFKPATFNIKHQICAIGADGEHCSDNCVCAWFWNALEHATNFQRNARMRNRTLPSCQSV